MSENEFSLYIPSVSDVAAFISRVKYPSCRPPNLKPERAPQVSSKIFPFSQRHLRILLLTTLEHAHRQKN